MATWTKTDGAPVTTEREVRVYCPDTGAEGYVGLSWELGRGHMPSLFGPVFRYDGGYIEDLDQMGAPLRLPRTTILDASPSFA